MQMRGANRRKKRRGAASDRGTLTMRPRRATARSDVCVDTGCIQAAREFSGTAHEKKFWGLHRNTTVSKLCVLSSTYGQAAGKPFLTPDGPKKRSVYVKNDKGNVVKVTFGSSSMEIKRDDPERLKSFRARMGCDTDPGPKWKANYWSCYQWRAGAKVDN